MQDQFNALRSQKEKKRKRKGRIHPKSKSCGENKKFKF